MSLLFAQTTYPLNALVGMIDSGQLGLPDLQRPFVWDRIKVRDLFDSLYRGYPAGYFLFWSTDADHGTHQIGSNTSKLAPQKLIVDGQQRLTSVYAVLRGKSVLTSDFQQAMIRIAFRPATGEFEVANASTNRDPEWLSSISDIWTSTTGAYLFTSAFLEQLKAQRELDPAEEKSIAHALGQLEAIQNYHFTALELSAKLDVEQVSEIFVRTNSKGVALNQADFILTLMSVYWDAGRFALERFCQAAKQPSVGTPSPYNHFIDPSPDQMLRVAIGLGFRRGQLRAVYQLLRGRGVDSQEVTTEKRTAQFVRLQAAQDQALDLTNWHEFLKTLMRAGYRSSSMITSDNNILYAYLVYLIGRFDFGIGTQQLRNLVARWFFMSAITGRYTGNFESQAERDLRRLSEASSAEDFLDIVQQLITTNLTNDFWEVRLPEMLDTSAAYSPSLFAYYAALNLLDAKVLFSTLTVKDLLDPATKGKKSAIERHHLFPRGYLKSIGINSTGRINQIANYAFVEWPENISISDKEPSEYFSPLWDKVAAGQRDRMRFVHALPHDWEQMDYADFLRERRQLMASVIRAGYELLEHGVGPFDEDLAGAVAEPLCVAELLERMETSQIEFKSSARYSYKPDVPEKTIHEAIIKTVAAFMNGTGGTLGIGLSDEGEILGIAPDLEMKNQDLDAYQAWLTTLFETSLGGAAATNANIRFEAVGDVVVCLIDVRQATGPVFADTVRGKQTFYVRNNNSTRVLEATELLTYIKARFQGY
jgi:hypothetical protein